MEFGWFAHIKGQGFMKTHFLDQFDALVPVSILPQGRLRTTASP
jgi:hypothetical protein